MKPEPEQEPEEEQEFDDSPFDIDEEESVAEQAEKKAAPARTPVKIEEPEEDDEEDFDDDFDDEEIEEEPVAQKPKKGGFFARKRAPEPEEDEEEEDPDAHLDEPEESDDEEEEEYVPVYQRPARKPVKKAPPVRLQEDEDEQEDDSDGSDSYEYEPTPPKRKEKKGSGPLFWILLVSIIIVIACIIVAGVLMLQSSNVLSCATAQQGAQPAAQQTATVPDKTQQGTSTAPDQQTQQNDPDVVGLEEYVNDEGVPCVKLSIIAPPHSVVTLQIPNRADSVTPNDTDNTVIFQLATPKSTFNPDVAMTESTYEVTPVIYRTESDGTTHQLTVPSFTLTFPTLTIDLERPVENEDGIIMADKENRVAISGHVDDFEVEVTVDGESVVVYEGGLFMADYVMEATEPTTVVITAEKPNYVSTSKEIVVNPYVFVPEKMVLTVANDPVSGLKADKSNTVSVRGTTIKGATLKATSDYPSQVVCGSVTVDAEGGYTFLITMDPSFYGVSKITVEAEKEDAESGSISFYVYRPYSSKDDFTKGYNKTKTYKEIGTKNPISTIVAQESTYASPSWGFRITASVESVETGADGLTYVKLKLTSGETVYAINYGERWSPASNVGKKYNLYGNFLGMYEDGSSPLFAIYFAVSK